MEHKYVQILVLGEIYTGKNVGTLNSVTGMDGHLFLTAHFCFYPYAV